MTATKRKRPAAEILDELEPFVRGLAFCDGAGRCLRKHNHRDRGCPRSIGRRLLRELRRSLKAVRK